MKKHALIITSYQELDYLEELCKVYSHYFPCYIHVDKKTKDKDRIEALKRLDNVYAISKYKINWGSYKHILAVLDLLKRAEEDGVEYYHIISANTIPIKTPEEIMEFFEKEPSHIYMEVKKNDGKSFYEFEYRYTAYFFQHLYDLKGKHEWFWERIEKYSSAIQRTLKIRKSVKMNYKGYLYCHLPREAVDYVLNYVKIHKDYIRGLKYCSVGEEFFFQNILMNSSLKEQIQNDTLIYDEWGKRGNPAFLDETDIEKLKASKALFARKVGKRNRIVWDTIREEYHF